MFAAIIEVIRKDIKECKAIHFDGNGYSEEWKAEAARRGLDCETSVPLVFDAYLKDSSVRMFESTGVMTRKELEARNEVKWEMYTKKIQLEARVPGAPPPPPLITYIRSVNYSPQIKPPIYPPRTWRSSRI